MDHETSPHAHFCDFYVSRLRGPRPASAPPSRDATVSQFLVQMVLQIKTPNFALGIWDPESGVVSAVVNGQRSV